MNKRCLLDDSYRIIGKDLTTQFDLTPFKVKSICQDFEKVLNLIAEKKKIFAVDQNKSKVGLIATNLEKKSIISLLCKLQKKINKIFVLFRKLFIIKFPLDYLIKAQFQDLHQQKTLRFFQNNKNKAKTKTKTNSNKKNNKSKETNKSKKTNKKKKTRNIAKMMNYKPFKKRNMSWFGFLYTVKDTLYHTNQKLSKIKKQKNLKENIFNKKIKKNLIRLQECFQLIYGSTRFLELYLKKTFFIEQQSKKTEFTEIKKKEEEEEEEYKKKKKKKKKKIREKKREEENKNNFILSNKEDQKRKKENVCQYLNGTDLNSVNEWEMLTFQFPNWEKLKKINGDGKGSGQKKITKIEKNNFPYDRKNYENFFVSYLDLKNEYSHLIKYFEPKTSILIHEWCSEMKSVQKMLIASQCASSTSLNMESWIGKWGKFGINYYRYLLMSKTAQRKNILTKTDPKVEWVEQIYSVSDQNRFFRWMGFRPYPNIKIERVRYVSKNDLHSKMSKKKSTYGQDSLELRIISNEKDPFQTKKIIIFIHGGAFVSGNSMTHGIYLRRWAKEANCTVIGIDYTLSPKKRIPGQIQDCLNSWHWITTRYPKKTFILAGDSAGGCLSCGLTMKTIIEHKYRKPDALVMAYPALHIRPMIGISRLLFSNDPLFSLIMLFKLVGWSRPVEIDEEENEKYGNVNDRVYDYFLERHSKNKRKGFLKKFTKKGKEKKIESDKRKEERGRGRGKERWEEKKKEKRNEKKNEKKKETKKETKNEIVQSDNSWIEESIWSPLWMRDDILQQFPETLLLSGLFDPFLDDNSLFADRMWQIGKSDFHFRLYALPHGFWTFNQKFNFKTDAMKFTIDFFQYFFKKNNK
ncbi:hormone-sensitive lipase [Anaeramoeba flamelloides]|uniref:Hormone-sensitive lipase n=1 Tax=Anaeramoeba flamelloides TaxID=1746091 RepID=A0ABQ8Y9W7_9EUKA|nr:hormone-sensitive lipase [Anaeramoeba flamelloides]